MWPQNCSAGKKQVHYNVAVEDAKTGKAVAAKEINSRVGYGLVSLENLAAGTYNIIIKATGNTNMATDFAISLYNKGNRLSFQTKYSVLSEVLRNAEKRKDKKVFKNSFEVNGTVTVKGYLDEKKQLLNVQITKSMKKDVAISIQFEADGNKFPYDIKSNTDWRNGMKQALVSDKQGVDVNTYFQMDVLCPR